MHHFVPFTAMFFLFFFSRFYLYLHYMFMYLLIFIYIYSCYLWSINTYILTWFFFSYILYICFVLVVIIGVQKRCYVIKYLIKNLFISQVYIHIYIYILCSKQYHICAIYHFVLYIIAIIILQPFLCILIFIYLCYIIWLSIACSLSYVICSISMIDVIHCSMNKSFDYRVLHLILYKLLNKPIEYDVLALMQYNEHLVDIADDLCDYEV